MEKRQAYKIFNGLKMNNKWGKFFFPAESADTDAACTCVHLL